MYLVFRGAAFILGSVLAGALTLLTAGAVVTAFGGRALAVWGLNRILISILFYRNLNICILTCSTSLATHVVF